MDAQRYATRELHRIEGWFSTTDAHLFRVVDDVQRAAGVTGDLVEIGVYKGRSAMLLGYLRRADERVVLCDPFDTPAALVDPRHDRFYGGATADALLARWRSYHARPPVLLVGLSTATGATLADGCARFIHIDGGHEFADAAHDLELAQRVSAPGAVVVLDDWRTAHAPGVGAAAWREVFAGRLQPAVASEAKLYASTDQRVRRALRDAVLGDVALVSEVHDIDGLPLVVVQPGPTLRRHGRRRLPWALWRRVVSGSRWGWFRRRLEPKDDGR